MNAEEICNAADRGVLSAAAAVSELQKLGYDIGDAPEQIFIALGGDDIVTVNAAGEEIYYQSGRTLKEVAVRMGEENGGDT